MSRIIQRFLRGQPCDIAMAGDTPDNFVWWLADGPPDPPLTEYELRAIEAIVAREFGDRRAAWNARKAERLAAADIRRRRAL